VIYLIKGNNDRPLDLVKRKLFHSTKLVSGASGTLSLHTKDNSPEAPDSNFFSCDEFYL
jgi:hypothetical protein